MDTKDIQLIETILFKLYKSDYSLSIKPYLYFSEVLFNYLDITSISIEISWGISSNNTNYKLKDIYLLNNASITEQAYYLLGIIHQHERNKE